MKKIHKSILMRLAVCAFFVYVGVMLFSLQLQINEKKAEKGRIESSVSTQVAQNNQTQRLLDTKNQDQYIAEVARDKLNYANPGEKVFIVADN